MVVQKHVDLAPFHYKILGDVSPVIACQLKNIPKFNLDYGSTNALQVEIDKNNALKTAKNIAKEFGVVIKEFSNTILYPDNGYMSWHTNSNSCGLRLYLNFSFGHGNEFRYLEDSLVKTSHSPLGCTARVFNITKEPLFWHEVQTKSKMLSIGFKVDYENC